MPCGISNTKIDVTQLPIMDINTNSTDIMWLNTSEPPDLFTNNSMDNDTFHIGIHPETAKCKIFRFVLYTIICGLLCLLGFLGNSLSFLVLARDRSTPVASFLLQVMAVADNLFLLLWFIHYSVRDILRYWDIDAQQHPAWIYVRVFTFPFLYMTQMETIWLTVVVAMNRYMAICLPYRAPHLCTIHNVYKEVIFVTVFSIAYNIPRFFELTVLSVDNQTVWDRTDIGKDTLYKTVYTDAMYYLFTFVLPLLILGFVNTRVIVAYQGIRRRKRRMTSRRADNENNITLVMIMVVAIFMLCQAPARIVQLVWSYSYNHCEEYQYYLIHISNSLEVLNSSINFLIYFIFRKRFRDILGEYYCSYGPMRLRRDSAKSVTTEGLALSEYQATTAGEQNGSIRDSIRRVFFGQSNKESVNTVRPNGISMTDKCVATNCEESQPLSATVEESVQNQPPKKKDKKSSPDEKAAIVKAEDNNALVVAVVTLAPSPVKNEVVDVDLSSENHPSRSSSPENCLENDDHMLMASV